MNVEAGGARVLEDRMFAARPGSPSQKRPAASVERTAFSFNAHLHRRACAIAHQLAGRSLGYEVCHPRNRACDLEPFARRLEHTKRLAHRFPHRAPGEHAVNSTTSS